MTAKGKVSGIKVEGEEETTKPQTQDVHQNEVSNSKEDVVFKVKDNNKKEGYHVRVFSHAEHGENYKELADEFEKTNTHQVLPKAVDPESTELREKIHVENTMIKHPIIERVNSESESE